MTSAYAQVADLREGDVVEMSWSTDGAYISVRGPLIAGVSRQLSVGNYWVRAENGSPIPALQPGGSRTLTVISRAPRPLYVNSDKTEPDPGDVVRGDGITGGIETWYFWEHWWTLPGNQRKREQLPARLRLLVDGRTGQVVV